MAHSSLAGSSLTGNGLLVSDGDVWRRQRRLSNPAFRRAAVEVYATEMVAVTQGMLQAKWASGGVRDVYKDYNELTLRITMNALFGADTDGPEAQVKRIHATLCAWCALPLQGL